MALTYGEISAITQKDYIPTMIDNIFDSNALLMRMRKGKMYKPTTGGTSIMEPLLYATTTASGSYSKGDTLNTTANDQITAAEHYRGHYYANITIDHIDELDNAGDAQVVDFVASKVQAAEMTLADNIGTGLFSSSGTSGKDLIGLRLAVSDTGTYGGIARGTYSWWACQEDSSTTTLTMAKLESLYGDCVVGNDKPTVGILTQDIYDSYFNLLTPQQRFTDSDTANGGYTNILFRGMPLIEDSHCPDNHLFLLNEKYLKLRYHPKDNFRFEPFIRPTNAAAASAKIFWSGQLTQCNGRMQGKFDALTA